MKDKSRGWLTILYPESMEQDWEEKLNQIGQQFILSPLHDGDINADGSKKKNHYHLLLLWDGPTTFNTAMKIVTYIKGVGCLPCATIRGSVRYFCHLDNPEKKRYSVKDMKQSGGLDIDKFMLSETEENEILKDIFCFIRVNHVESYADFVDYCRIYQDEWFKLIMHKHRENVFRYIRSIEYDNNKVACGYEKKVTCLPIYL